MKTKNIPQLRFPEFKDCGEWEERKLGDNFSIQMCKRIMKNETSLQGKVPFYKIGTIGGIPDSYISEELYQKYKKLYNFPKIDEVLITCSGTVGKCIQFDGNDAYYQDSNIVWLSNQSKTVLNKFIFYVLKEYDWNSLSSTTITRIYTNDLKKLLLSIPNIPEQQKIADCLSSLGKLINAQSQKIEKLKDHKKGLLQKLFPQEGKNIPELRFPEFKNYGEWEEKELGNTMKIGSSKRVHESDWKSEGIPFFRARDIVAYNKNETISKIYISKQLYEDCTKITGKVLQGHILITGVGTIGVTYLVKEDEEFYFKDGNIIWLQNDNSKILSIFLQMWFTHENTKKRIRLMASVGTVATFTISNAKQMLIKLPTIPEQQKIVDCLSSLDELIDKHSQKLELLKAHKKGLMQGLFPCA